MKVSKVGSRERYMYSQVWRARSSPRQGRATNFIRRMRRHAARQAGGSRDGSVVATSGPRPPNSSALSQLCFVYFLSRTTRAKDLFRITRERSLTRPEKNDPLINVTKLVSGRERRALSTISLFFASCFVLPAKNDKRERKERKSKRWKRWQIDGTRIETSLWFAFKIIVLMFRKI